MTGAQPGMTEAVRNNEGSQFREDERQSPSLSDTVLIRLQ